VNTRTKLDEAKRLVSTAAYRIQTAEAGLARLNTQANGTVALQAEVDQLNAENTSMFTAWAAAADGTRAPSIDGQRLAQAQAALAVAKLAEDSINAARAKLQLDLSHTTQDKLAAEASLNPLALSVLIDETLPVWIESAKSAITEAHRQSDRITAFSMFATAQAHQAMGTPQEATMFSMAQQIRDAAAIDRATLIDAYAGDNARTELLDMLLELQQVQS
jgi:hypothetical protein